MPAEPPLRSRGPLHRPGGEKAVKQSKRLKVATHQKPNAAPDKRGKHSAASARGSVAAAAEPLRPSTEERPEAVPAPEPLAVPPDARAAGEGVGPASVGGSPTVDAEPGAAPETDDDEEAEGGARNAPLPVMTAEGLFSGRAKIAPPFAVSLAEHDTSGGRFLQVSFVPRVGANAGREVVVPVPAELLHGGEKAIAQRLQARGLNILYGQSRPLAFYLSSVAVERSERAEEPVAVVTDRCGWHRRVYLYPDGEVFGPRAAAPHMPHPGPAQVIYTTRGALPDWQREVGALAVGNATLVFAICHALIGPVLGLVQQRGGGWHFWGRSSSGKSMCTYAAASAWGHPEAVRGSWDTTRVGPEEALETRSRDGLACFDDISKAPNAATVESIIYSATEGGRVRASRDGSTQRRRMWRLAFWSTGEVSLERFIGERMREGAANRVTSVRLDVYAHGCFQQLHGSADGQAFAQRLEAATFDQYGTLARAWVSELARRRHHDEPALAAEIRRRMREFVSEHLPSGQLAEAVTLVAERAALCAAVGEIAAEWGLLPWPRGEATRGVAEVFIRWRDERGDLRVTGERQRIVRQIVRWCDEHRGDFAAYEDAGKSRRARGYYWLEKDGSHTLLIPKTAWDNSVCAGLDPQGAANVLRDEGLLLKAPSSTGNTWHLTARWLPVPQRLSYYKLRLEVFERA